MLSLYGEPWWLQGLAALDLTVIGHKTYFSHNYQLTAVEAYADMFILTGESLYLDALMGAWAMHRDPLRGWIHVGGSLAINEGDIYEPGSFWLLTGSLVEGTDGVHFAKPPSRQRDWFREERGISAGEKEWAVDRNAPGEHAEHGNGLHPHQGTSDHAAPENGGWPTGEFCGAVFWLKINQRLHRLYPENETFVLEMEREV